MQFSVVALLSLVALAYAAPAPLNALAPRVDDLVVRADTPPAEASVMTDAEGNVVAFNSATVYQATTAKGQ